jgi:prepilin-type processing-associated H-X9-DG protein
MLFCPTEKNRQVATNFSELSDANLSYFADVDAGTNKQAASILSGDRHLQADGKPVRPGLFTLTTNLVLGWTGELHSKFAPRGSLAFVDGHVENVRTNLSVIFQKQDLATNRLAVP